MIGRVNVAGRGEGPAPGPAYSIEKWCKVVGLTYSDISDITEADMRKLMSKHASVDYFMEWYASDNSMLDMFTVIESAMKWIGLNDYIADKLLAIEDAESRLLASEYWPYILKDHVPIMTANDAPYGEAFASSADGSKSAYHAFEDGERWASNWSSQNYQITNQNLGYTFATPICVKRIHVEIPIGSLLPRAPKNYQFQASNGEFANDVHNLTDVIVGDELYQDTEATYEINNNEYHLGHRMFIGTNRGDSANVSVSRLQFYGRALSVSVPTMTSNTSPYGEVISNGTPYAPSSSEPQLPYEAFDGKTTTGTWLYTTDGTKPYVGYDFKKEIVLKYAFILANGGSSESLPHTSRFETSLDGEHWFPFGADVVRTNTSNSTDVRTNTEGVKCRYVRNIVVDTPTVSGKTRTLAILKMNFYGVDYSDRTERTYLYDHGVDVVPTQTYVNKSDAVATKEANRIKIVTNNAYAFGTVTTSSPIDLSPYKLLRCTCDDELSKGTGTLFGLLCAANSADGGTSLKAWSNILEKECFVDISSVNESQYISILGNVNSAVTTVNEIWLE